MLRRLQNQRISQFQDHNVRISKPTPDQLSYQSCLLDSDNSYHPPRYTKTTFSLRHLFAIPNFDPETEQLFWQERHLVLLTPLKWALYLGALAFLAYLILDLATGSVSPNEAILRLPIILVLLALLRYLHISPQAIKNLNTVAKLSAGLSALNLTLNLLYDGNSAYYAETWPGLLPMYFFSYGQMFMSLRATISFGWITALTMPIAGYMIGVDPLALIPSMLNLLIVNIFGLCTRCQLEAYARRSFLEKRKAENSAQDKTRFLHQLSHNLRQPLQALSCYSSVLDAASAEHPISNIQHIANRMGSVIDELNNAFNCILDITNLENGKQMPSLAAIDINVLLTSLENQFAPLAAQHGIQLKISLRSKPPYTIHSDISILSQIIGNLLDNAIKYTHKGWIVVAAVKISPTHLKLHIYDTGAGIAKAAQEDIFKEFFRNNRRQNDNLHQGLGLGLAYVGAAILRLQNHHLKLTSKPAIGSDFQLFLPVIGNMPSTIETVPENQSLKGCFVILVDDDPEVLTALTDQLKSWGCIVQTAGSLSEIQSLLTETLITPDLLISDFYLQNQETAHDIIATVQANCEPLPTLILSARAIIEHEKQRLPTDTVILRKPASANTLMKAMIQAMKQADSEKDFAIDS